jgi:hypothetical protein
MKFSQVIAMLVGAGTLCAARPECLTEESAKRELASRSSEKCASQVEVRKEAI